MKFFSCVPAFSHSFFVPSHPRFSLPYSYVPRQSVVAADELETLRSARVAPGAPVFDLRWFNPRSYMRVVVHLGGLVSSTHLQSNEVT
ncbi:unnamed protein product [Closterium sp. Yama58-4]|nr:unnamed protein product [Closterium sp. Yama58-4]